MPPDIHVTLWRQILDHADRGTFCWNREIWKQLELIQDAQVLSSLRRCNRVALLQVGQANWPFQLYLDHLERVKNSYGAFISEYNGNRKSTVNLVDCSIVCLGMTLELPVLSMETPPKQQSQTKMRIPELCMKENVLHYDVNQFLRQEGITL